MRKVITYKGGKVLVNGNAKIKGIRKNSNNMKSDPTKPQHKITIIQLPDK